MKSTFHQVFDAHSPPDYDELNINGITGIAGYYC